MMEENLNEQLDLPPEACHYFFRIAGHTHVRDKIKLGMLKHSNGNILKPLLSEDVRSIRELSFYEQITENSECDPILCDLKLFLPSFFGTWETDINGTSVKYLCIEDICGTFQNPSVLDIKIGTITYDPLASKEKIERETKKYPVVEIFGFRILGMKVYDQCSQVYISKDKKYGLSLKTADDVNAGLKNFFNNKLGQINCLILSGFYHKLLKLKDWFSKQRKFVFISSSVLFVYESNLSTWLAWMDKIFMHVVNAERCKQDSEKSLEEITSLHWSDCSPVLQTSNVHSEEQNHFCGDCYLHQDICNKLQENCALIRISMLDFAHVFSATEEDSNYTFGLNSLISYWQQLMKVSMETYL